VRLNTTTSTISLMACTLPTITSAVSPPPQLGAGGGVVLGADASTRSTTAKVVDSHAMADLLQRCHVPTITSDPSE
jgi:hypothetical protein